MQMNPEEDIVVTKYGQKVFVEDTSIQDHLLLSSLPCLLDVFHPLQTIFSDQIRQQVLLTHTMKVTEKMMEKKNSFLEDEFRGFKVFSFQLLSSSSTSSYTDDDDEKKIMEAVKVIFRRRQSYHRSIEIE